MYASPINQAGAPSLGHAVQMTAGPTDFLSVRVTLGDETFRSMGLAYSGLWLGVLVFSGFCLPGPRPADLPGFGPRSWLGGHLDASRGHGQAESKARLTSFMQQFVPLVDRLALQEILEDVGSKFVSLEVDIFPLFAGLVLTSFSAHVATGFALTFYYRPAVSEALASVRSIMVDVHSGWLIRSGHRWGASLIVCCIVLHVCRVSLTGGFQLCREVTWITGVALAVCTVSGLRASTRDTCTHARALFADRGHGVLAALRPGRLLGTSNRLRRARLHSFGGPSAGRANSWRTECRTSHLDAILHFAGFRASTRDSCTHARALFAASNTRNFGPTFSVVAVVLAGDLEVEIHLEIC